MWSKDRRQELALLQHLLRETSTINHGNHFLERITQCIGLAERLMETDLSTGRPSFMQFLIEQAAKEPKT